MEQMNSPFKVLYYIQDVYDNYPSTPKVKYSQILLEEEAVIRAKGLLKSLKSYYKVYKDRSYDIRTLVVDYKGTLVGEFK